LEKSEAKAKGARLESGGRYKGKGCRAKGPGATKGKIAGFG
jgi:hypothetical protein